MSSRVALSAADHSLACVHQHQLQWSQEQALGSFTGTLFLDLPAPTPAALAEYRAAAPSLRDWIHLQVLMLKVSEGPPQGNGGLWGPCLMPLALGVCTDNSPAGGTSSICLLTPL